MTLSTNLQVHVNVLLDLHDCFASGCFVMKVDVPCWHLPEMWSFGLNGLPCSGSKDGVVIGPPVCSSPSLTSQICIGWCIMNIY